jgi:DNA-directed RNA polymerase subunit RPC12/RpoP
MSETVCAQCEREAETQWRIDLETERDESTKRTRYPLCRECWGEIIERFAGPAPKGS